MRPHHRGHCLRETPRIKKLPERRVPGGRRTPFFPGAIGRPEHEPRWSPRFAGLLAERLAAWSAKRLTRVTRFRCRPYRADIRVMPFDRCDERLASFVSRIERAENRRRSDQGQGRFSIAAKSFCSSPAMRSMKNLPHVFAAKTSVYCEPTPTREQVYRRQRRQNLRTAHGATASSRRDSRGE